MASQASTLPKRKPAARKKSRKRRSADPIGWWPLAVGILITPFAVRAATLMALTGPDALRLLYPWALLPKLPLLGISASPADTLSQAMMYLQFPLYGLFIIIVTRWKSAGAALLQLTLLHILPVGLLLLTARL